MNKLLIPAVALAGVLAYAFFENRCSQSKLYEAFKENAIVGLTSPASAVFPPAAKAVSHFFNSSQCAIIVDTHVDSQNSFGAMLRTKVTGTAKRVDGLYIGSAYVSRL